MEGVRFQKVNLVVSAETETQRDTEWVFKEDGNATSLGVRMNGRVTIKADYSNIPGREDGGWKRTIKKGFSQS
ncbi:hypothetical protein L5515_018289 [Caenorhabditis briggsae]|uniref:Uncharacterized protein n=1 Tax=Caenorhabditis briggsae TaxID=6238 RepID=A0AAE9FIZ6_CAEBR|nr:hypothetical protein L5515_018289 [Caenorhabditis briggsae]